MAEEEWEDTKSRFHILVVNLENYFHRGPCVVHFDVVVRRPKEDMYHFRPLGVYILRQELISSEFDVVHG